MRTKGSRDRKKGIHSSLKKKLSDFDTQPHAFGSRQFQKPSLLLPYRSFDFQASSTFLNTENIPCA